MALSIWTAAPSGQLEFDYYTEEEAAAQAIEQLREYFDTAQDFCHLVFNFHCRGEDLDALVIKRNAIIVIDLKDCAQPIDGGVNGTWTTADGSGSLNKGRRNPFQQDQGVSLRRHESHVRRAECLSSPQKATQAAFAHVSSLVCVSPLLHPKAGLMSTCIETVGFMSACLPETTYTIPKHSEQPNLTHQCRSGWNSTSSRYCAVTLSSNTLIHLRSQISPSNLQRYPSTVRKCYHSPNLAQHLRPRQRQRTQQIPAQLYLQPGSPICFHQFKINESSPPRKPVKTKAYQLSLPVPATATAGTAAEGIDFENRSSILAS